MHFHFGKRRISSSNKGQQCECEKGREAHQIYLTGKPIDIIQYERNELAPVPTAATIAKFSLKGEDQANVARCCDSPEFAKYEMECPKEIPRMVLFAGVYDGHGGPLASQYCSDCLHFHVLIETEREIMRKKCMDENQDQQSEVSRLSDVEKSYDAAFCKAQEEFAKGSKPLNLSKVRDSSTFDTNSHHRLHAPLFGRHCSEIFRHSHCTKKATPGGTTACTIAIYSGKEESPNANTSTGPFALVANCGDCRLLTDDGTGTSSFRQVTKDHRPSDPVEKQRLMECQQRGEAYVSRMAGRHQGMRVFPGGLAVSRSIGDLSCCRSVIPKPDVFRIDLSSAQHRTHRFVIASDGLWDVLSNEEVGTLAARLSKDGTVVGTKEAATRIMKECMGRDGGSQDDVTVLVVDAGTDHQ